jgi:hypothetical protein
VNDQLSPEIRVPIAANARHATTATSASAQPASSFATTTRVRSGTSVNVVSAVRCDHSLVTSSRPTIGSSTETMPTQSPNSEANVWSSGSPAASTMTTTASALRTTSSSSQKPARVSVALRSSTEVRRGIRGAVMAAAVMPPPPLGR